jgi:hypothetical protein
MTQTILSNYDGTGGPIMMQKLVCLSIKNATAFNVFKRGSAALYIF